jgi:hypothetical protein
VNIASARNTIFPVSEKNPLLPEDPDAVVVAVVVVRAVDRTEITTTEVLDWGGVPPSVAVTVKGYVVPAGTPDRSTFKRNEDNYTRIHFARILQILQLQKLII